DAVTLLKLGFAYARRTECKLNRSIRGHDLDQAVSVGHHYPARRWVDRHARWEIVELAHQAHEVALGVELRHLPCSNFGRNEDTAGCWIDGDTSGAPERHRREFT